MRYLDQDKNKKKYKDDLAQVLEYLVEGDSKKANKLLHEIIVEKAKKEHNENL